MGACSKSSQELEGSRLHTAEDIIGRCSYTNGEAPLEQSGITIWKGGGREAAAGAAVRPTAGKVLDQSSTVHIRRILHDDIHTIPKEELPEVCIGSR